MSLDADEKHARLLFQDSGCGISLDYVQKKLYEPFTQADPLTSGMGLGLALVHNAVESLGGDVSVQTDEAAGTDFTVTLPRAQFSLSGGDIQVIQNLPEVTVDFSFLKVCLLAPRRWQGEGGDHLRKQRCLDAFVTSLRRTLSVWCLVDLQLCSDATKLSGFRPDVIFVLHSDLGTMRVVTGAAIEEMEKVVFCPDQITEAQVEASEPRSCTTIMDPVVPSKIISALSRCVKKYQDRTPAHVEAEFTGDACSATVTHASRDDEESEAHAGADKAHAGEGSSHQLSAPRSETLPRRSSTASSPREPKLLLVDDNAINLRILVAFAKKISKKKSISAAGGKAAIEEFKAARANAEAFDIILLDLSMPDVSGFEVAAAIRQMELDHVHPDLQRTYIVALTGLVSDKDREAAFAAGVDDYVTKPAALKDVQQVVENWRNRRF